MAEKDNTPKSNPQNQAREGNWRGMARSMLRELFYDTLVFPLQQRLWGWNRLNTASGESNQGQNQSQHPVSRNQEDEAIFADICSILNVGGAQGMVASDHLQLLLGAFQEIDPSLAESFRKLLMADYKPGGEARQAMDKLFDSLPDGNGDNIWQFLTNPPRATLIRRALHYARMVEKNIDQNTSARDAAMKAAREIIARGDLKETAASRMTREGKHFLTGLSAPKINWKGWRVWILIVTLVILPIVLICCSKPGGPNPKDLSACARAKACKELRVEDSECKALLKRWSNACGLENPAEKALAPGIEWLQSFSPLDGPKVKLQSTKTSLKTPGRILLSWEAQGADQCVPSWRDGVVEASGNEALSIHETTVFSLTCQGKNGNTTASIMVEVSTNTAR